MNTTPNPDTLSDTSRAGQRLASHAPRQWTSDQWMFSTPELLILLSSGLYLAYYGGAAVTHHWLMRLRGSNLVWGLGEWQQCLLLFMGVVLLTAAMGTWRRHCMDQVMHPYGDLRRWANESADRLLRTMKIDEAPVDPLRIAERLGMEIVMDGCLSTPTEWREQGDHAVLVVNRNLVGGRRFRFEVAHAIGHCMRESGCTGDEGEEFCCREFAGALLMPRMQFLDEMKRHTDEELANMYDVDATAVEIRRKTIRSSDPSSNRELERSRRSFG